jgi:FtsH-binding integral membrane protein
MSYLPQNEYPVAQASVDERASFIVKTYVHLAAAIFAFVGLEYALFALGIPERVLPYLGTRASWIVVMVGFMAVGMIANWWARSSTSMAMQYAGLGLYVAAEAVVFMPMLLIAANYYPEAIPQAGLITLVLFGGLTGIVFLTRKDFSFLKGILGVCALGALGLIICSFVFGFTLGTIFSAAMVVLMGGYILYYTSNVMLHYRTTQHVAAALALFASIATLFWYILQIFMRRR